MKKLAFLLVLVAAFTLCLGVVAFAAETPHGPFDDNSAVCAACHRAHTSSAEYLLATPKVTSLCIACHDGSGADTNVVTGTYVVDGTELDKVTGLAHPNGYDHGTWGQSTSPLMGGGFLQVRGAGTTSKHMDPTAGSALTTYQLQFGAGLASNAPGTVKLFLDCVDCHMPHRSPNYRMLRVKPTGYTGAGNLSVPEVALRIASDNTEVGAPADEITQYGINKGRRYTEDSGMFNYTISGATTAGQGDGMSKWCGLGCHDFYYRSAVRGNNGEVANPSPAMQTRLSTTYVATTTTINVANGALVPNPSFIWIADVRYTVTNVAGNVVTINPTLDVATLPLFAGTPVSIEGKGMEVYYDLNGDTVADPNFMHAIDVDLNYYPRNGSSGVQHLGANLGTAGATIDYSDKMPVADMAGGTMGDYDDADRMTCLTCHRAHGTDAGMQNEAAIPTRNFGNTAITGFPSGIDSMLLRLPNRAVCQQCHQMPNGF